MCVSSFSLSPPGRSARTRQDSNPRPSLSVGGGAAAPGRPAGVSASAPTTGLLSGFRDVLGGEKEKQQCEREKGQESRSGPETTVRTHSSEGHRARQSGLGTGLEPSKWPRQPLPLTFSGGVRPRPQGAWEAGPEAAPAPDSGSPGRPTVPDCPGGQGSPDAAGGLPLRSEKRGRPWGLNYSRASVPKPTPSLGSRP